MKCKSKSGSYTAGNADGEPTQYETRCKDGNMRHVQKIAMDLAPEVAHTIENTPQLEDGEELRLKSV